MSPVGRVLEALSACGTPARKNGNGWQAKCPAHDDRSPSLSISEGRDGRALLNCHAGCETPAILAALGLSMEDLFVDEDRPTSDPVIQRYVYTDEDGTPLFRVCRTERKRFFQERCVHGSYTPGLGTTRRVLYHLPEALSAAADGRRVFVVEGEKDADALRAAGATATTSAMGAGKWRDEYSQSLAGADVVVVADKDGPGYAHAASVVASLEGHAASVRMVQSARGKDASDHLAGGFDLDEFVVATPPDVARPPAAETSGQDGSSRPSQADRLVSIGLEVYQFGVTDAGDSFAVPLAGPRIALPLRGNSQSLRAELSRMYFMAEGKSPRSGALADALTTLQGFALHSDPTTLHLRYARHEAALWVDLGTPDGAAACVDADGWRVCEKGAPVTFCRSALTKAMPRPVEGGSFAELRDYVNVADDDWALIEGFAVAALVPEAPQPILVILGEQGTGKSGAARCLVAVIDPSTAPLRSAPRDVCEWAVTAAGSSVIALDNLSAVSSWLSDALCRGVTGDGLVRRQLYSDGDLVVTSFRKMIVLTGIDLGPLSADVIDRAIFVELQRIPPEARRLDADIERDFDAARGRILGGLLDLVSAMMRCRDRVGPIAGLPRMADHAYVLAALDKAVGGNHLGAYMRASATAMVDASDGNALVESIVGLVNECGHWSGSASELYALITPDGYAPRSWPKTASHLSGALKRIAPVLLARGVNFESPPRTRAGRVIVLSRSGSVSRDAGDGDSRLPF